LFIVLQITSQDFTNHGSSQCSLVFATVSPIASATPEPQTHQTAMRRLRLRVSGVRSLVPQVYDREKSHTRIAPKPFYNPVMPVTSIFPNKRCAYVNRVAGVESAMTATIAECAENARQSKWFASKTKNEEERKFLLRMAKRWSELAAEKEREVLRAARSAA
jgi:hypothetical protein